MPGILRPDQSGGMTSTTGSRLSHKPSNSAALPCEITVPSPHARQAASIRPCCPMTRCPTAKVPRKSG
jgi:hypothetical protein